MQNHCKSPSGLYPYKSETLILSCQSNKKEVWVLFLAIPFGDTTATEMTQFRLNGDFNKYYIYSNVLAE